MSHNSTICPSSGRKRWKCLCADCVADRHPEVHTQSPEAEESQALVAAKRQFAQCAPTDEDWCSVVEGKPDPGLLMDLRKQIFTELGVDVEVTDAHRIGRFGCAPSVYIVCTSIGDTRVQLPKREINALPVPKLTSEMRARLEIAGMHHLGFTQGWLREDLLVTYQPHKDAYLVGGLCQTAVTITALHMAQVPKHLVAATMNRLSDEHRAAKRQHFGDLYSSPVQGMTDYLKNAGVQFDMESSEKAREAMSQKHVGQLRMAVCSTPMSPGHNWVRGRCQILSDKVVRVETRDLKPRSDGDLVFEKACDLMVNGHKLELRMEGDQLYVNGRLV